MQFCRRPLKVALHLDVLREAGLIVKTGIGFTKALIVPISLRGS